MKRRPHPAAILLAVLSAALAVEAILSVWWGMELDSPDLSYLALMIDRFGRVPYAQTFDPSAPGSLLFHLAIGKSVGYGEIAFGIVNLLWLGALLWLTWRLMSVIGRRVAWAACVLVGLGYLQHGRDMSLQRDYVAVLPIVAACLLASRAERGHTLRRAVAIGILFGVVATIKPQLALGLPFVVVYLVSGAEEMHGAERGQRSRSAAKHLASALFGAALPVAMVLVWVAALGGWRAFTQYFTEYLPLYLNLDGDHHALTSGERPLYLLTGVITLGGLWLWVLPAALGLYAGLARGALQGPARRLTWLLVGLAGVYAVYPALSGQFFDYHWMPFQQFALCLAALVLVEPFVLSTGERAPRWFGAAVLGAIAVLALRPAPEAIDQLRDRHVAPAEEGRADQIAAFLRTHLQPGDSVQPLDWVNG
ncbi:MAG: hypothetical protein QOH79_2843, partial [Acidimicrobiaceae bacterium]